MLSKKKPKLAYSHEDFFRALEAVKDGESVNMASTVRDLEFPSKPLMLKSEVKTLLLGRWALNLF